MVGGGKEKELRMFDLKAVAPFANAALAQEEDLLPAPQGIDDDGPFFECCPHGQTLTVAGRIGNRANVRATADG